MYLEYISTKVSKVRSVDNTRDLWFGGTYGDKQRNQLSVWCHTGANDDTGGLTTCTTAPVAADVNQINVMDGSTVIATLANGHVMCFGYEDNELRLRHEWHSIDNYSANDSVVNPMPNQLIVCGDNGVIRVLSLEKYGSEMRSKCLTQNSLKAIDLISTNEVICGTSAGHLKVYDLRDQSVVASMANELSVVTCVKRNPCVSHVVSCGNDVGVVSTWDLRQCGQQLLQVSAHSSFISDLKYKPNEPNVLMTSSYDGSLLRWNITASTQLGSVEAIVGRDGGSPINSFDVNSCDQILFSADNEVLYLGHL